MHLLNNAIRYGELTWKKIISLRGTDTILAPLLDLTIVIEEQIQNLTDLCTLHHKDFSGSAPFNQLIKFYSLPKLHRRQVQLAPNHHIADQLRSKAAVDSCVQLHSNNYYHSIEPTDINTTLQVSHHIMSHSTSSNAPSSQNNPPTNPSYFVEDMAINAISEIVEAQMLRDKSQMETEEGIETMPIVPTTVNLTLETPILQRVRFNLIRHRYARNTELTTLQLFKSFINALKKADKHLTILPCDSMKQHYTLLVSIKQIDSLNENQLHLYFHPWYKQQHYSLSGYFHLNTMLPFQELMDQTPVAEWLDTYQYATKICQSQSEEMVAVGALCYGSTWIYREDLKMHILQHQMWKDINNNADNPIIFDLILRRFRSNKTSVLMIFVTAERSKQEIVRDAFKTLYDGTQKSYPRGDMMLFIPIKTGELYDQDQQAKYIYNHETYLGEEDVTAIHGLNDLNTEITLKGGTKMNIRMLLKSLPATQGMQRNRLFHIIDPNAGNTCTIATFQKVDKAFIEQRKLSLEQEIRSVLEKGEASKVFLDEVEGIWFGGTVKHKNGKPIAIHTPSRTDLEYQKHTDSILNNPPNKKRPQQGILPPPPAPMAFTPTYGTRAPHRNAITPSEDNPPVTIHLPANAPNPINADINNRFRIIETELNSQRETQKGMDQRLHHLEHRTTTIDDNINQMMAFWKIAPTQKRKADSDLPDSIDGEADQMETEGNAPHPLAINIHGDESQW